MVVQFKKAYLHRRIKTHSRENSKMFNIACRYFIFFNNKSPASWVVHTTRDFLSCYFCLYYSFMLKGRYTRNEVEKWNCFFLNQLISLCFRPTLKKFSNCQNCPKKMKNLYLIKFVSKWKRVIRKWHRSFLVLIFGIWDLR